MHGSWMCARGGAPGTAQASVRYETVCNVWPSRTPLPLTLRLCLPTPRLGALSGILATVTFPPLHRRLGLVATGGFSIWLQLACLLAGVAPALAAALGAAVGAGPRMYALVWGLVLSRFGLWSFDLAGEAPCVCHGWCCDLWIGRGLHTAHWEPEANVALALGLK